MVDDTNEEFAGKKIIHHKPLIEGFVINIDQPGEPNLNDIRTMLIALCNQ
jgi:hypothetical protein